MSVPGFLGLMSPDVSLGDAPIFPDMKDLPADREERGDRQEPSMGMGRVVFRVRLPVVACLFVLRDRDHVRVRGP